MNILSIKLHQPTPPPKIVERPALIQRLNEGIELGRPMTLVSAPAGFGKTTCICEWLAGWKLPVAWLSLDEEDNNPGRFFLYLAAALRKIENSSGEGLTQLHEVERVLNSGQLSPADVILSALVADILEYPGRFILVLDDFHLIQDPFILKVFERLIASLFQVHRPQPLHLVLLSREDPALPVARLRANNQLTEIRASELRFSRAEAAQFLNSALGLSLENHDIRTLADRTEGWITGLQLAGLSIRGRADPSRFIHELSGSHRFILSYLIEEVLSRQADDMQQFLLETSILDQLSGDLCRAVTGRADSPALLEQLWGDNLFLVPLDEEAANGAGATWYRYHHLFSDLLRNRQAQLQGEKTAELHRRASRWFAQACAASPFDSRAELASAAIRHALSASDYAGAVQLMESYAGTLINLWYSRLVTEWIQALPPEWSAKSPRTSLAFARMHLFSGDFKRAAPYLEHLQTNMPQAQPDPGLTAEWLALQSTLLSAQGQPEQALVLAQQALAAAPERDSGAQTQVYLALAVAYQQFEQPGRAEEAYQRLIQLGRATGSIITEIIGVSALALMWIQSDRLKDGYELARLGADRVEQSGILPPMCAGLYGELGVVCYMWNRLDEAERYLHRAAQVSTLGGADAELYYSVFRSILALARGNLTEAALEIKKATDLMQVEGASVVREEVMAQQARVALAQNELTSAEQILAKANISGNGIDLPPDQRITYNQGILLICALRIALYRGERLGEIDSLRRGIELADQVLEAVFQRRYIPLAIEALLLRAQLYARLGNRSASQADYLMALELAEPQGVISSFLEAGQPAAEALAHIQPVSPRAAYIQRILNAFPLNPGRSAPPNGLIEPLTDREIEVLRRMAEGATYDEIAGKLVVSINTVRTHIKAIYGKLGVNNRTAAISAAQQMKILPE